MKMKKITKQLVDSLNLKDSKDEDDVKHYYRKAIELVFPNQETTPKSYADNIFKKDWLHILVESKYSLDLSNAYHRAVPIVQSLAYLKRIQIEEAEIPHLVFIESREGCFNVPVTKLEKYLNRTEVNWIRGGRSFIAENPELVKEVANDKDVNSCAIYKINNSFDLQEVVDEWKYICTGKQVLSPVTLKNVQKKFKFFKKKILGVKEKEWQVQIEDLTIVRIQDRKRFENIVNLFMTFLTDERNCWLHPKLPEKIVFGKNKHVEGANIINFKKLEKEIQDMDPKEKDYIVANRDKLMEELNRRYTGAYFTPKIWVDEAHKYIEKSLGKNWKDEWVVWDCAAGTANLTRYFKKFKNLFISTLEQGDIDNIIASGYNPKAKDVFQYNFLSECPIEGSMLEEDNGLGKTVPYQLRDAFTEGKKILFFINPPFGAGSSFGEKSKPEIEKTKVNEEMLKNKMGMAAGQLYTQFLYKILLLKRIFKNRIAIATFSSPKFLCCQSYNKFRQEFYKEFSFKSGMLFSAGVFSDVQNYWGVSFTVWDSEGDRINNICLDVKQKNSESEDIEFLKKKEFTSIDNRNVNSYWVGEQDKLRREEKIQVVPLSNAIQVSNRKVVSLIKNSLGCFPSGGNSIETNEKIVLLFSTGWSNDGWSIVPENFSRVVAFFTARKTIRPTWINCKDEYLWPNTSHPDYEQWNNDCIVYSLFNGSSQQSSLRNVEYKGEKHDITNQFFFMSLEEMRELADKYNYVELQKDAYHDEDRYVYKVLRETNLSPDAKEVLDSAIELVKLSFEKREEFAQENPKYHLQAWDAGWAQLKPLFKKHYKEQYNNFVEKYKAFENRMREGVYKFEFLRR